MNKSILDIQIIWHTRYEAGLDYANLIFRDLTRDVKNPLKRTINIPITFVNDKNRIVGSIRGENKKIAIVFVEAEILLLEDNWVHELKELYNVTVDNKNILLFPILMDDGLNVNVFGNTNYLLFDHKNVDLSLLKIYSEVFTFLGNNQEEKTRVFVSHTREDDINITNRITRFIRERTHLEIFFDAQNIRPATDFEKVIIESIRKENLLLLAIAGNEYINRSWCKREILTAKEYDVPVLILNYEKDNNNNYYPYLSGMKYINTDLSAEIDDAKIAYLIKQLLLISIERRYSTISLELLKENIRTKEEVLITNFPEPFTLVKISKMLTNPNGILVLYPDPPLMSSEIDVLTLASDNVKFLTPMTINNNFKELKKVRVMISIADVMESQKHVKNYYMIDFFNEIVRYLFIAGFHVNYGGNIHNMDSDYNYVDVIFDISREYIKHYSVTNEIPFVNYIAPYIAKKIENRAKLIQLSKGIKYEFIESENIEGCDNVKDNLLAMRKQIVQDSEVLIAIGGKTKNYSGYYPGVLEEVFLASKKGIPIFILGAFGGISSLLADKIMYGKEVLFDRKNDLDDNYNKEVCDWLNKLDYKTLNNGLNVTENQLVMCTTNVNEAIYLIKSAIK